MIELIEFLVLACLFWHEIIEEEVFAAFAYALIAVCTATIAWHHLPTFEQEPPGPVFAQRKSDPAIERVVWIDDRETVSRKPPGQ